MTERSSSALKPQEFMNAVGDDLRSLAVLHDREPTIDLIEALEAVSFPDNLGLRLTSESAEKARSSFATFFSALNGSIDQDTLYELCAEYADIYLNFSFRASPTESPWTDEDGLERQNSMFAVRLFYRDHGLSVQDWARRSDDHIVHQLHFIAHLLEEENDEALKEAARFLDAHPLCWIDQFAAQVAQWCQTPYFAGVAHITIAYLTELRQLLCEMGYPLPVPPPEN